MKKRIFFPIIFLFTMPVCILVTSFSEEKKPVSLEYVVNLLKSNVSKKRVLMTVEENGIKFPKTKNIIENLKTMGADEIVLAAIEKEWQKDDRILIIETVPIGATIYLDGEKVGEAPLEIGGLKPRKYSARVEKEGYKPVDHEISLAEGMGRKLKISLLESNGETSSSGLPIPPGASPPPTPMKAPLKMCSLFVNTHPVGAKIYVNGKHYGTSPKYIELLPGEYSIVLVKEYYNPTERRIVIREGETVLLPIDQTLVPMRQK